MGDYRFEKVGREILRYAKNFPDGKNTHSFPYKGQHLDLHLDMYAIAETFDASFLKWTVHQKLTEALLVNFVLSADEMATFVNKVFHAGDGKIVEDSERRYGVNMRLTCSAGAYHGRRCLLRVTRRRRRRT
jgi:hypothetical protein